MKQNDQVATFPLSLMPTGKRLANKSSRGMQLLAAVWEALHQHTQATKTLKQGNRAGIPRQVTKCRESDAQARRPGSGDTVHTWRPGCGVGVRENTCRVRVRLTRKSSLPWSGDFYGDQPTTSFHSASTKMFSLHPKSYDALMHCLLLTISQFVMM